MHRLVAGAGRLALVLVAVAASAGVPDVPQRLSYQGVLLDALGDPRTGSVDLTLRIYDALGGGTLLYKQTLSGVALADGVFSVELGPTGAASDVPDDPLTTSLADALAGDLPATGPSRFLEVTVGLEGALTRTQILTVPYALRAEAAASAETAETAVVAQTALDAQSVNGLSGAFVTAVWEHTNLDDSGPPNNDPREGLGDTDSDGIPNFVDPDNDDDGLSDSVELAQGSDMNLVTPVLSSFVPPSGPSYVGVTVTVNGANFEPGLGVAFGSEMPAPLGLTATSFDVSLGPQPPGTVPVVVTRLNGESDAASYAFVTPGPFVTHAVPTDASTKLGLGVAGSQQTLVVGSTGGTLPTGSYGVDTDASGSPETVLPLQTCHNASVPAGQIAVGWSPAGQLAGLTCISTSREIVYLEDSDADYDLEDEPRVVLHASGPPAARRLWSPSLVFDGSGRPVLGYVRFTGGVGSIAAVSHDRDGDGAFTGTNEIVDIELAGSTSAFITNLGEVAVDAGGHVVYAYASRDDGAGTTRVRVAWDRSGDGDFDDAPGGNPELFTLVTLATDPSCLGAAFTSDGRLAVVYDHASTGPTLARDLDGDGDFGDAGESVVLAAGSGSGCDVEGGGPLAVVHTVGGEVRLLVDRNEDGDFDDTSEDVALSTPPASLVELARAADGRVYFATHAAVLIDPVP